MKEKGISPRNGWYTDNRKGKPPSSEFSYLTFNQSATWLYEIINYDNMASSRVSLFYAYNSLIAFPNFGTNNLRINYAKVMQMPLDRKGKGLTVVALVARWHNCLYKPSSINLEFGYLFKVTDGWTYKGGPFMKSGPTQPQTTALPV